MKTSDEDLAKAAAEGDVDAFATLLQRHYDRVFRLAFRLTGRADQAEDLTQDICAALPAKISGFRAQAKFTTWLYRVVVNAAEDSRRRNASRNRAAVGWGDVEQMRRAEAEESAEALGWLQRAMQSLPPELQDTLALTLEDEMTHAEAAVVLGVSEGTVSWRMSDIRKRLRILRQEELAQ
ncbi:RNA polymerase sigma factor [Ruegeria sp. Ofav3-42]|uniref:RNA polymerase sigma factor n=1 Tax=Ruegeria sp. Ofav3-42 TaxID=2917759 RepID=UPI001EF59F1C|nr:RNA polymerase sigma factor [Ruegeria sp. Ofav3-42]MCG7522206.1 RNA polymerase sigma factor [Ruegeria sp. Ofav3-42]